MSKPSRAFQSTPRRLSASWHSFERDREPPKLSSKKPLNKAVSGNVHDGSNPSDINADLVSLIQKLTAQVDDLTAMVAGQQKD